MKPKQKLEHDLRKTAQDWDDLVKENAIKEAQDAQPKIYEVHSTDGPQRKAKAKEKGNHPAKRTTPGDEEISSEQTDAHNYQWNEKNIASGQSKSSSESHKVKKFTPENKKTLNQKKIDKNFRKAS